MSKQKEIDLSKDTTSATYYLMQILPRLEQLRDMTATPEDKKDAAINIVLTTIAYGRKVNLAASNNQKIGISDDYLARTKAALLRCEDLEAIIEMITAKIENGKHLKKGY